VAAHQHQQDEGQEFTQAHEAERQRIARQGVDLPAHRHRQHLPA
jgi:hypothetical protein